MLYTHLHYSFMAALAVLVNTNIVNADTNGIIFPPADDTRIYEYPPEIRSTPQINSVPQAPTYMFGKPYPQQPVMAPPTNLPKFIPNQMPSYGAIPSQRPAVTPRMQNRGYPIYPYSNNTNSFPFANSVPFGNNTGNSFNPFSSGNSPFSGSNNPFLNSSFGMPNSPMNNMFGNNNNSLPFFKESHSTRKKAWGDERNIWPDFYTDFTDEAWDNVTSGPRDLGEMPGGWRFPYISMPDPVTVSDAITNQFPPIAEETGNMADFSDWGVFE